MTVCPRQHKRDIIAQTSRLRVVRCHTQRFSQELSPGLLVTSENVSRHQVPRRALPAKYWRRPAGHLRGSEHTHGPCPTERRYPIVSRVRNARRLRLVPVVGLRAVCPWIQSCLRKNVARWPPCVDLGVVREILAEVIMGGWPE